MPGKIRVTCGNCGTRFPTQGVVKQCISCKAPLPDHLIKLMQGEPSAVMDVELSAMMDHLGRMVEAKPPNESSGPPLVSTLKAKQEMPEFIMAMFDVLKGNATPDQCAVYIRSMLSMCLQMMVDYGGEEPVVQFKKIIVDWFRENLPGVEPPYLGEMR